MNVLLQPNRTSPASRRGRRAVFGGRAFAVLASGAIHGALALLLAGLPPVAMSSPLAESLDIEMLPPEEPSVSPPIEEPVEPPEPEPEPPAPEEAPPPTPEPHTPLPADAPPPPEDDTEEAPDTAEPPTDESEAADDSPESPAVDDADAVADPLLAGNASTGFAVRPGGRGSGKGRSGPKRVRPPQVKRPSPPATASPIPLADLSERPSPPPLDALLERNYPPGARDQGRTGSARVALLIGSDGKVRSVRIVGASAPEFGEACARTLRESRWSAPKDRAGKPVPTIVPYECRFRVHR